MRTSLVFAAVLLAAAPLAAQSNPQCSGYPVLEARNVCNAAIDGTRLFHPLAGLLVSGGNPEIGTARTLGGLPHFSVTARVNAVQVPLPDLNYDGTGNVPLDQEIVAPAPLVEAGLGLWKGLNGGLLSVDFLGSAQLLPTDQVDNLTVDADASHIGSVALGLGYGVRVGVLRGTFPIPSISVSAMRRGIPQIQYGDITDPGQDYQYAVDLQATNLRVMASTKLLFLNVAGGLGWDKYTGDAVIAFRDPLTSLPQPPVAIELDNSRTMAFVNLMLDFPVLKIAAELGYQGGKNQNLATDFDGVDETKGHLFGGAGVRLSF